MEEISILRSAEVIKNLMANRDFGSGEAYAYAFGWCWVMLTDEDRERLIELTKEKN